MSGVARKRARGAPESPPKDGSPSGARRKPAAAAELAQLETPKKEKGAPSAALPEADSPASRRLKPTGSGSSPLHVNVPPTGADKTVTPLRAVGRVPDDALASPCSPSRRFSPKAQRAPFSPALQRFLDHDPFELVQGATPLK